MIMNITNWTLKSDVLAKVKQDGNNLRFAAPELKADHDVVIEAFKETEESFYFACESLKSNSDFALKLLKINSFSLSLFKKKTYRNKELTLFCIENIHPSFILCNEDMILNNPEYNLIFLNATIKYLNLGRHSLEQTINANRNLLPRCLRKDLDDHWYQDAEDPFITVLARSLVKLDLKSFKKLDKKFKSRVLDIFSKTEDIWESALTKDILGSEGNFNLISHKLNKLTACPSFPFFIDYLFMTTEVFTPSLYGCRISNCPCRNLEPHDEEDIPF